jgi:Arc/MetJ family transcription regulator
MYIGCMAHRTSIELDETLLTESQRILGTSGIRDTVEGAMRELLRADRRARLKDRLTTGAGIDRSVALLEATRPTR